MGKVGLVAQFVFGVLALSGTAIAAWTLAIAHEGHKLECTDTAINATRADIQAMPDGEAKTNATQELQMAEHKMAKKDMEGCVAHLHRAMEAMED